MSCSLIRSGPLDESRGPIVVRMLWIPGSLGRRFLLARIYSWFFGYFWGMMLAGSPPVKP